MALFVPYTEKAVLGRISKLAKVLESEYGQDGVSFLVEADAKRARTLRRLADAHSKLGIAWMRLLATRSRKRRNSIATSVPFAPS